MVTLVLALGMFALTLVLRLAHKLRLTIPFLYLLIVPTLLKSWYLAHTALAKGIFCALLALAAISWLISLGRIVSDALEARAEENAVAERFAERVRQARANGESIVSAEGLW